MNWSVPNKPLLLARLLTAVLLSLATPAAAQRPAGTYHLLDPLRTPPGLAGVWSAELSGQEAGGLAPSEQTVWYQPVRFTLPSTGRVTFYPGSPDNAVTVDAPAQVGLLVGRTYRIRLSDMPEFPGVELYPSIEMLDRLHPPPGYEQQFPIPVDFSADEIQLALKGHLVTRVVYLEQPQVALPAAATHLVRTVPPSVNVLAEADRLGRPLLIIRLGGRQPLSQTDRAFFGVCPPLSNPRTVAAENRVDEPSLKPTEPKEPTAKEKR